MVKVARQKKMRRGEAIAGLSAIGRLCSTEPRFGSSFWRKYNRSVYSLYSILLLLALVVSAPWWLLEMLRHGKYRAGLGERLGKVPDRLRNQAAANTIWIHAVSVGEVLAISRVIAELKAQLPAWRIVISTTTDTGQKLARERFGAKQRFLFPHRSAFCGARVFAGAMSQVAGAGGK